MTYSRAARQPYESLPPLAIITGAITVMGGIMGGTHYLAYGKPKPVAADAFDRLLERRDTIIRAQTVSLLLCLSMLNCDFLYFIAFSSAKKYKSSVKSIEVEPFQLWQGQQ